MATESATFSSPLDVHRHLVPLISFEKEELWVLALNSNLNLIAAECLFRGTANECLIHPRDIFRFACLTNAVRLILCHSHPSGCAKPSAEDLAVTRLLINASKMIKIPIDDHIILTKTGFYSFRLNGKI